MTPTRVVVFRDAYSGLTHGWILLPGSYEQIVAIKDGVKVAALDGNFKQELEGFAELLASLAMGIGPSREGARTLNDLFKAALKACGHFSEQL